MLSRWLLPLRGTPSGAQHRGVRFVAGLRMLLDEASAAATAPQACRASQLSRSSPGCITTCWLPVRRRTVQQSTATSTSRPLQSWERWGRATGCLMLNKDCKSCVCSKVCKLVICCRSAPPLHGQKGLLNPIPEAPKGATTALHKHMSVSRLSIRAAVYWFALGWCRICAGQPAISDLVVAQSHQLAHGHQCQSCHAVTEGAPLRLVVRFVSRVSLAVQHGKSAAE